MTAFLPWYLLITALGLAAVPLANWLFAGLADRGYAFGRILGLLVWGYAYWLLGYLGILRNELASLVLAFLVLAGLSAAAWTRLDKDALRAWLAEKMGTVLLVEVLFLAAFLGWTVVRGMNPEITATEKPMELAFLNSILRSPGFPPNDPWLSGYAISYYYFGYTLVGMLALATGTAGGVAFNLGVALVFGLAAVGAYGVVYNLLAHAKAQKGAAALALFGPLYVLLVSNWEGFLDLLHARGLFWTIGPDGALVSRFWRWLDLKDLVHAPVEFAPTPQRFLWWWRASRVINDVSLSGEQVEVIDEFPFFSFLLSDLHPHVLSIPFVLLAIAWAWNVFVSERKPGVKVFGYELAVTGSQLFISGLIMGALAFLNIWDFPIYVGLFTGSLILKLATDEGWSARGIGRAFASGFAVGVCGLVLYFPFYIGFSSQAGGILPNVINPTRGAHLWVMFGPLFVPILLFLVGLVYRREVDLGAGLRWGFGIVAGLFLVSVLITAAIALVPEAREEALRRLGAPNLQAVISVSLSRRANAIAGLLTLAALLSLVAGLLARPAGRTQTVFTIVMVAIAGLLIVGPEFVYLRDLFGSRMNTIFKFYYQAWILLALAAGYATARVLMSWERVPSIAAGALLSVSLFAGLVYPVISLPTKTEGFSWEAGLNLDGTTHGAYLNEDDRAAVAWLQAAELGVLVEAVGGSYSSGARISTHSGQPTVVGWIFHQGQWRGGYEEVGSREGDVERIYTSGSWAETAELLDRYGVTYIYLGSLERTTYEVNVDKFEEFLPVLFEQGAVTIYGYTPTVEP